MTETPIELPVVDEPPPERADAQRNRMRVLDAAARLIAAHGVENVSMDAIAAEAGVGKGTLFRRFGDRAGLAFALLEERTRAMQDALIRGPAPLGPGAPPRERIKAAARAQFELLAEHADLIRVAEAGRRFAGGPYTFLHTHVGMLVREGDPDADWELVSDILLAPLAADSYTFWCRVRGFDPERVLAAYGEIVDRVLPES